MGNEDNKALYETQISYQRERLRTNFLLITCCAIKRQGNYVVCNESPSGTVGWIVARGAAGFRLFCSSNPEGSLSFFLFSKFLSSVSLFRVRVRVRVVVRIRVRFKFKPSSPIVHELVLNVTWLSFPLVRFRQPVRACETFVYSVVRITRLHNYQT